MFHGHISILKGGIWSEDLSMGGPLKNPRGLQHFKNYESYRRGSHSFGVCSTASNRAEQWP